MKPIESFDDLTTVTRDALVDLLYRLGDDELVLGHRNSEWTGLAPILEEDIAFSSMAQDEMGHAQVYYQMLHALGEPDPDTIAFSRKPREYRCASLVSLANDKNWAFCLLRQFLYDASETVRLTALCEGTLVPLAQAARKIRSEEKYHLMHGRSWVLRLGNATDESHERMQTALYEAYPHALGLFEPTAADEPLTLAGICPREEELRRQWESAVAPVLADAGLEQPETAQAAYGGRVGHHPESLTSLLNDMQIVYKIDPAAKW